MKVVCVLALVLFSVAVSLAEDGHQCVGGTVTMAKLVAMEQPCTALMKKQVTTELGAAIAYLRMAAYFSKDTVNRPGFAKFFFESASEEREHAIKFIQYLLMRGELTDDVHSLIENPYTVPVEEDIGSGMNALDAALKLEQSVTASIQNIIVACEDPFPKNETACNHLKRKEEREKCKEEHKQNDRITNDYHLVDYLTGEFLEEQYKGQRDIAGKLATLEKMDRAFGSLGEFLFDKKLLGEEITLPF